MRNLLAFLGAVVLTVVIAGWYLDWYKINAVPSTDGHRKLNIDINTSKVGDDLRKGGASLEHLIESAHKPASTPTTVNTDAEKAETDKVPSMPLPGGPVKFGPALPE